jgi:predicted Zn-dependent peptidase
MIGGQNNAFTTKEMTCFYIRVLPEYDRTGLELMADMVLHPRFAAEDIDTERGVILEEISMYDDDAEDLAADGIYRCCWAPHAIGASIVGTAERVRSFTRDDILRFYHKHYRPDNIVISLSGKFDEEAILAECERLFGDRTPVEVPRVLTVPGWNAKNVLELR